MCARGDGIRRSKDLRAEIGKFPNSTNERKQMSNKTLKQRVVTVAVAALTAGFLAVVPTTASANGTLSAGTNSVGVITAPTFSGATGTGALQVGGNVTLGVTAASASLFIEVRISGGTFEGVSSGASINGDRTVASSTAANTAIAGLVAKASTAGRNMVVNTYIGASAALASAATTATSTLTVTVYAAGAAGVVSVGNSFVQIMNTTSTLTATSNTDTTYANVVAAGGYGAISYNLVDGASVDMPSTTTVQATVKSGACIVDTDTTPAVTAVTTTGKAGTFYVTQTDGTNTPPAVCSIEISANGTAVATKTLTFQGPVAKINVTSVGRATASSSGSATSSGIGFLTTTDAAGNVIGNQSVTGYIVNATDANIITAVAGVTTARNAGVNAGTSPASTPSSIGVTCVASTPTTPVKIQYRISNGIGGFILSDVVDMYCGSSTPVRYSASLDKASYAPGDVAVLTITATDSKGAAVSDAATLGAGSTITVAGGVLTAVTAPASLDTFTAGKKTYNMLVGTTEGAYNLVVDLPARNSTTYSQNAVTVPYKVALTGPAVVSNAQVLQSIVALIASINKQIQALQKLILARR